jgi:Arc/MetJ-type ribon-helix-helix transcriptional regulator
MVAGMTRTTRKITISVPEDDLAQVTAEVRAGHAESVSAFFSEAARRELARAQSRELLAEWQQRHGVLADEEIEAARRRVVGSDARPDAAA